jgi:hypothetical protein
VEAAGLQLGGSSDLSGFADPALDWLAREKLEGDRRRASALERLTRPDLPNLVDLVQADLKSSTAAASAPSTSTRRMTQEQLEELDRGIRSS